MKNLTLTTSVAALVLAGGAASAQELNVLTWEGYADDSFIKPFEEASGCKVNATYVGSNDDFAPKLAAALGKKLAAQTVPVIGAAAGAAANLAFTRYYQEIAHVSFGLKALARDTGQPEALLTDALRSRMAPVGIKR